jgi:hypothetical protein
MLRKMCGFSILALLSVLIGANEVLGTNSGNTKALIYFILFITILAFLFSWKNQSAKDPDFASIILVMCTVASLKSLSHEKPRDGKLIKTDTQVTLKRFK